jgi:membrane protease YdiL (CAAX protease family)
MPDKPVPLVSLRALVAVILSLCFVLVLQAWATLRLQAAGYPPPLAEHLPRLVGLPLLFAAAWLIVMSDGQKPAPLFAARLRLPLVLAAVAVGLLARVAEWAQITVRGAFGLLPGARAADPLPFSFGWNCPEAGVLVLAFVVWLLLVPVTEEFLHRGIVQNAFRPRGALVAILLSTLIFMLAHPPASYPTVFVMGMIFGLQYWNTGVLWYPVITHAVYDGLIPLDQLCLRLAWNPAVESLPAWQPGLVSFGILVAALASVLLLLHKMKRAEPAVTQPATPHPSPQPD